MQIKYLFILSHLLISILWVDPKGAEQVAVIDWVGGTIGLAHNYMSGEHFHDLQLGDTIYIVNEDHELVKLQVVMRGEYLFEGEPSVTGNLWVDGGMITISQLIEKYSSPGSLTLITCWPRGGETTGQLILKLSPVQENEAMHVR